MQAVLVFLASAAIIGGWRGGEISPFPRRLLIVMSALLAVALYSRRVI